MFRKGKKLFDKKIILESIFKPGKNTYIIRCGLRLKASCGLKYLLDMALG